MKPADCSSGSERQIVLLAPEPAAVSSVFRRVYQSAEHHSVFLSNLQRLRGAIYLRDGAIHPDELSSDGRHIQAADSTSWHIVVVKRDASVVGCTRFLQHDCNVTFQQLALHDSVLSRDRIWGSRLRIAVETEIAKARRAGLSYVEIGGWVVAEESRHSGEALRTAITNYALARLLGGSLGISTATVRHNAVSMLRRIGGKCLEINGSSIPRYYEPRHGCEMEILCFDSRSPGSKYEPLVEQLRDRLSVTPVICGISGVERLQKVLAGFAIAADYTNKTIEQKHEQIAAATAIVDPNSYPTGMGDKTLR